MSQLGKQSALRLVQLYQFAVSPLLGPACRFEPSCSHYATEALEKFGLVRGCWLAGRRIARCHPFAKSGYDPVPGQVGDGS